MLECGRFPYQHVTLIFDQGGIQGLAGQVRVAIPGKRFGARVTAGGAPEQEIRRNANHNNDQQHPHSPPPCLLVRRYRIPVISAG